MQTKEIEEHKYFLSERLDRDVGWDYAISDWVRSGHAKRFRDVYLSRGAETIDDALHAMAQHRTLEQMTVEDVHTLLGD